MKVAYVVSRVEGDEIWHRVFANRQDAELQYDEFNLQKGGNQRSYFLTLGDHSGSSLSPSKHVYLISLVEGLTLKSQGLFSSYSEALDYHSKTRTEHPDESVYIHGAIIEGSLKEAPEEEVDLSQKNENLQKQVSALELENKLLKHEAKNLKNKMLAKKYKDIIACEKSAEEGKAKTVYVVSMLENKRLLKQEIFLSHEEAKSVRDDLADFFPQLSVFLLACEICVTEMEEKQEAVQPWPCVPASEMAALKKELLELKKFFGAGNKED